MTHPETTTTRPSFAAALAETADAVEQTLDACLPRAAGDRPGEDALIDAMRYAVMGGGKRLRAFLAVETAAVFSDGQQGALRVGAALECLHAYSLVHDDMPCMDDDDLRRGKPTVHKRWDEATAVLAGDALQTIAFEILADPATHADGGLRATLCLRLAQASGVAGMVGGQALDLAADQGTRLDAAAVKRLQAMKTGALLEVSAELGALIGGALPGQVSHVRAYARALGEAFQIADDLLDVTGTEEEVGKRVGKDEDAGKATFIDVLGMEGAKARAAALVDTAAAELTPFGDRAALLVEAARFVVTRRS
ncbi:MAG: polyprenyl synthetase family protein [Pseudomonadota bacterium]